MTYNRKEIRTRSTAKVNQTPFGKDKVVKPHIPVDPAGYWNPNNWGKPVTIPSGNITGVGINEPLIGIDNFGTIKPILPGTPSVRFPGDKVTEYPMSYFDVEADDDIIAQYKAGGFVVEELPKAQDGQEYYAYEGRPGSYYRKVNGKWQILNDSTKGKFIDINDPKGERTKVLNAQAYKIGADATKKLNEWGLQYKGATTPTVNVTVPKLDELRGGVTSMPVPNIFADPKYMTSQQLLQKAYSMGPTVESTKWLEMAAVQKKNEEAQAAYKKLEAEQARYDRASGAGSSSTNYIAPSYTGNFAPKQTEPKQEALPYVMAGTDGKGTATLITKEQAQKIEQDVAKDTAFRQLQQNRKEIEQVLGRKLTDEELYDAEGNYNKNYMVGKYYNQDFLNKIEDQKYKNFQKWEQEQYDKASWLDKTKNFTSALLTDLPLTVGNLMEGKGPLMYQSALLRGDQAGLDPSFQQYARQATNADDYWLNDWVNYINPFDAFADAAADINAGNYGSAAFNILSAVPVFKGVGVAGKAVKASTLGKNFGKASHAFLETPLLRTTFKPSTLNNALLQQGESALTKGLLDLTPGKALQYYSTAALPGAVYNYSQDRTAGNLTNIALLAAGTPYPYQAAAALGEASLYAKPYAQTIANIAKGEAPLSFKSFQKQDLFGFAPESKFQTYLQDLAAAERGEKPLSLVRGKFLSTSKNPDAALYAQANAAGETIYGIRFPQTVGSGSSFNIAQQYGKITPKLTQGTPLSKWEQSIQLGAERSVLPKAQFEEDLASGAYSNLNLSDDMISNIRKVTENPNTYWNQDWYLNNPELRSVMRDPVFVNKSEYLLPYYPKASDFKAVGDVQEFIGASSAPLATTMRAAAMDKAAAERVLAQQESKVLTGKTASSVDGDESTEQKTLKNAISNFAPKSIIGFDSEGKPIYGYKSKLQDGGSTTCPEGYVMYKGQCVKWNDPGIKYVDTNEGTGYDALNNMVTTNLSDANQQQDWWMEHEKYHHLQNLAGGMSSSGLLGQRPNPLVASEQAIGDYYDVRPSQVNAEIDKMIAANSMLQFIPREKLRQSATPIVDPFTGKLVSPFVGADARIYSNPTTIEGDARVYEQSFRNTGKSIFPKKQNGGTSTPAYEGELTEKQISLLKQQGFDVQDVNLNLPENEHVFKRPRFMPYAFADAFNENDVNNVIFGLGVNAMFDTPLKRLSAGLDLGVTDMFGFDRNKVLYNDFRINPPTARLQYTIPYKKR